MVETTKRSCQRPTVTGPDHSAVLSPGTPGGEPKCNYAAREKQLWGVPSQLRATKYFDYFPVQRLEAGGRTPHFAIITTVANELMQPIHSRMPVILDAGEEAAWLVGAKAVRDLIGLLETPPSLTMRAHEVSRAVNRASVDTPEVIKPAADVPTVRDG